MTGDGSNPTHKNGEFGGRVCENVFTTSLNIRSNLQICLDLLGKMSRSSGSMAFTERQPMIGTMTGLLAWCYQCSMMTS